MSGVEEGLRCPALQADGPCTRQGKMQRADCLLFNTLPFMEDHRSVKFSSFNNEKVGALSKGDVPATFSAAA